MPSKAVKHLMRAPKNAPAVTLTGGSKVTSNKGTPTVKIGGSARPTTTGMSGGK